MPNPAEIAAKLTPQEISDIGALGEAHDHSTFGGLFDALSCDRLIRFKELGLIRSYMPVGCQAPLTKLSEKGLAVRAHLEKNDG